MANLKRLIGFSIAGTAVFYYSPYANSKATSYFRDAFTGFSWEQVKLARAEQETLRMASRPNRDPWYNGDRSRMSYYLYGEECLRPPGADLPKAKDVLEHFIEYEGKARIRPLGPWFDSFSDPNSEALLEEYTRRSPYKAMERVNEANSTHYKEQYKSSFGGATYAEGVPRGATISAFLYDVPGYPEFYDKMVEMDKQLWENLEDEVEDPKIREQVKDTVDAFKMYWGEQLEEYLPFIACRPKQKEKLAHFYMNTDPREIAALCLQKDGFKQILLAAGCDLSFNDVE